MYNRNETIEAIAFVSQLSKEDLHKALRNPDSMIRAAASWRVYPQYNWEAKLNEVSRLLQARI